MNGILFLGFILIVKICQSFRKQKNVTDKQCSNRTIAKVKDTEIESFTKVENKFYENIFCYTSKNNTDIQLENLTDSDKYESPYLAEKVLQPKTKNESLTIEIGKNKWLYPEDEFVKWKKPKKYRLRTYL